jgi:hypothetical protein
VRRGVPVPLLEHRRAQEQVGAVQFVERGLEQRSLDPGMLSKVA